MQRVVSLIASRGWIVKIDVLTASGMNVVLEPALMGKLHGWSLEYNVMVLMDQADKRN